jgi:hypothetical protein
MHLIYSPIRELEPAVNPLDDWRGLSQADKYVMIITITVGIPRKADFNRVADDAQLCPVPGQYRATSRHPKRVSPPRNQRGRHSAGPIPGHRRAQRVSKLLRRPEAESVELAL